MPIRQAQAPGSHRPPCPVSPVWCCPQAWAEITSQTEGLSRLLRQHAEDLNAGPLSKLGLLIRERQQLRKAYSEQWQQLQQELTKVGGRVAGASASAHRGSPKKAGFAQGPLVHREVEVLTAGLPPGPTPPSHGFLPALTQGFSMHHLPSYCVPGRGPCVACAERGS